MNAPGIEAMNFYSGTEGLKVGDPAIIVNNISRVGGLFALLGVVLAPITSGDTAFRSARLTIADALKLKQDSIKARFIIAIPLFTVGLILCFIDFTIIWRYFAWSNQTLATIMLWTSAVYLAIRDKNHWIASIPGAFMTSVVVSYILVAAEGFGLRESLGIPLGIISGIFALIIFLLKKQR